MKQLLILASEERMGLMKDKEANEAGSVFCAGLNLSITMF